MPAERSGPGAWPATLALCGVALAVACLGFTLSLPPGQWLAAAIDPQRDSVAQLVFHFSSLPRLVTAFLCGAGLSLAGLVFQQVLRNPLASPTTLGVSAGAQLALAAAAIWAPALLLSGQEIIALAGAAAVAAAVFAIAWARGFSSLTLILAGLVIGLACWALSTALKIVNQEYIAALFIWGAGSLAQQDWSVTATLLPRLAVLAGLIVLLRRPLELLALDEDAPRALGVPVAALRVLALALAVMLTSTIVAAVGIIGFLELAAPQIARLMGARRLASRLVITPLVGGSLLVLVDQVVQFASRGLAELLPTGAATALLGAPILLWLLPRLRTAGLPPPSAPTALAGGPARPTTWLALVILLGLAVSLAILAGRDPQGLHLIQTDTLAAALPWRLPRIGVALAAGAMLAVAGVLLQRLTGNPMAGPEILGIGAGVGAGVITAMLIATNPAPALVLGLSAAGALGVTAILLWTGWRSHFAPEPLLITGLALSALLDAFVVLFLAMGDFRAAKLLMWISGATYFADGGAVLASALVAGSVIPMALAMARWLDILPLGATSSQALGVDLRRARLSIMIAVAVLVAAAMLAVGPLSFVGLIAPHLARMLGLARARAQLLGATLIGAIVMVGADWIGRTIIFPYELSAGLVAALIGMPYLVWQLSRRG